MGLWAGARQLEEGHVRNEGWRLWFGSQGVCVAKFGMDRGNGGRDTSRAKVLRDVT